MAILQPKYSVLVMGKTQAGKSTLIEHIKKYANPGYNIDTTLLGNGNVSKTKVPRTFVVDSALPVYEAYRIADGETISLDNLSAKFDDQEDYREFVMSREKDVGMRISTQEPSKPSEIVEFHFLDTPGLNDTADSDTAHASNIINEMIGTRSFNLIVIIVSYKNPLTQEQQLALEYYANVFKGLHTRIMFLHTHVDYTETHHTNTVHHLNMKMKNKALSKMFRRHDSEVVFDEDNFQEYSSFTIDMVSKKRPVILCLIRNTIREILKKATDPPAILDTSAQNIERIRAITHPTKFNDDERKKIKLRFQAEAAKLPKVEEVEQAEVGGKELDQINILLIGDVQSGKSSLVETFKLYADPDYVVNTQHITQGNSRYADEKVKVTAFLSDLHTVQIRKLKQSTGGYDVIDLEQEAARMTEEDFEDLLNLGAKGAVTAVITANASKRYRFNIYEGPSLNESAETFEKNIFSVHKTLVESKQYFHQVLFTLAPGPITSAIRTTIRVCSDIFSDLNTLFSFVHTKVDYPKLHFLNKQFQESMKERQELLQRYIHSGAKPYLIDNNLTSSWPVQRAKTQNVVYEILQAATNAKPIALKSPLMKKTPKMVSIDTNLKWQARDEFQETQKEITKNNDELLEIRNKIRELDNNYKAKDLAVNSAQIQKDAASRDDLEIVFKERFDFDKVQFTEIYSRTMTFKKQARQIEEVSIEKHNVVIEQALGGKGCNHWKIIYRRENFEPGSLEVILYAKKPGSDGTLVGETKELTDIRLQRAELEKQLVKVEERIRSKWHLQKEYNLLRDWISRETLPKAVMEELTKEEVYEAKDTPFDKIRAIYLKSGGVYDTDPCEPMEETKDGNMGAVDENDDCKDYFNGVECLICKNTICDCDKDEEELSKDLPVRRATATEE
ncbi:hypothetical protein BG003_009118 [Podila horticola]|nr:hypothetical protein BG003_009118 [Podila horticola]